MLSAAVHFYCNVLQCFLLERFLHDLVFESMSPDTVREFLGVL
jgi:hypothetical protein